jgi:hypothetical protein
VTKRIFIAGTQSSGSSFLTLLLAQREGSAAIIDLWGNKLAPFLEGAAREIILKATIDKHFAPSDHCRSFRPDIKILIVRHPVAILQSLHAKEYAHFGGSPEEKISACDALFANWEKHFDLMVAYEDLVQNPSFCRTNFQTVGLDLLASDFDLPRELATVVAYTTATIPWAREHYNRSWGPGNVRQSLEIQLYEEGTNEELSQVSRSCAPALTGYYRSRRTT